MNDFIKALGGKPAEPEILVYFKGSSEAATFTKAVLHLLKTDPATEKIIDKATGETIYKR